MQTIQTKIIETLQTVKERIEEADHDVLKREKYFAGDQKDDKATPGPETTDVPDDQMKQPEGLPTEENAEKFKKVGYELLDISVYYTQQGMEKVKSQPLYQKVDSYVNFDDKFALVKQHGESLYTKLGERFRPLYEQVFFLYDTATNQITSFVNVITTRQQQVREYVDKTYGFVTVNVQGQWMRLDFDNDGSVSVDDLKSSMVNLYDFLRNFDMLETTTQIKTKLYTDAIAYMQNELEEDRRQKEQRASTTIQVEESSLAPEGQVEPIQPTGGLKKEN